MSKPEKHEMNAPTGYFVYVPHLRGPSPEKWPLDMLINEGGSQPESICKWPLRDDEYKLSLDELVKRYPLPESVS